MQPRIWVAGDFLLAFVPVILAGIIASGLRRDAAQGRDRRWTLWAPLGLVWLIFLPNTAYLLTEWRHYLNVVFENPVYRHVYRGYLFPPEASLKLALFTAFYVIYTGAGLITLFLSVRPLDQLVEAFGNRVRNGTQGVLFVLCSFGVFLGFVEKLNSWEIVSGHALEVVARGAYHVLTTPAYAVVVAGFAAFLWAVYRALVLFERGWIVSRRVPTIL